jgi:hypothetical protein
VDLKNDLFHETVFFTQEANGVGRARGVEMVVRRGISIVIDVLKMGVCVLTTNGSTG